MLDLDYLPDAHARFLETALPCFQADRRIIGVAGAGSMISQTMDSFSDLDLVIVVRNDAYGAVQSERHNIAQALGQLLASFTGEHVGEPRLLICLYNSPLLHVDLKFISLDDFKSRIEDPLILWERDDELSSILRSTTPNHPRPDPQWIEDRFWIWIHYAALRLGRGELFEAIDFLTFLRGTVLGPLSLAHHRQLPRGVRRLESLAPEHLGLFKKTVATHSNESCAEAIRATIELYLILREETDSPHLTLRHGAQAAALKYFEEVTKARHYPS